MIMVLLSLVLYAVFIVVWKVFLEECSKPKYPKRPLASSQTEQQLFERIDE